jgi:hypothetical protein
MCHNLRKDNSLVCSHFSTMSISFSGREYVYPTPLSDLRSEAELQASSRCLLSNAVQQQRNPHGYNPSFARYRLTSCTNTLNQPGFSVTMQTTDACSEVVRDIVNNHIVDPPAITGIKGITGAKSEEVGNNTYNDITSDLVPTAVTAAMVITNAIIAVARNVIYDERDSELVTPPPFDYHSYPGTSEPAPMKPILLSKLIPIEIRDEAYEIYKASHHKARQNEAGVNGEIFKAVEGLVANEGEKSVDRYITRFRQERLVFLT